jgi:hypothetical protein
MPKKLSRSISSFGKISSPTRRLKRSVSSPTRRLKRSVSSPSTTTRQLKIFKRSVSNPNSNFRGSVTSLNKKTFKRSVSNLMTNSKKQFKRSVSNTSKNIKTAVNPTFGSRAKAACKLTKKHDIFTGGLCKECLDEMPKQIANIKYLTDIDLVNKLENVCKNNDKLNGYCNKCKHIFIVQKSNIGLFSSKEFKKAMKK